jgi:predicted DNA-binding protein (MmcQ/YjbR family)
VYLASDVPADLIRELVRHSYDLVVEGLPAGKRPST